MTRSVIGETVSHYRVLRRIGEGGMGVVYEAEDPRLGRRVALKFLPDELAADPVALERFRREAKAASALNHPNVCTVYDVGEHRGRPFIAMELLDGRTLKQALDGRPLATERILQVGAQLADALVAGHARGIVHRDVKSANVVVTERGQAKLLDFGLARHSVESPAAAVETPTESIPHHLTQAGTVVGTLAYMSPEQVRGTPPDARSDLFSLGVVLYEMATGVLPFRGRTTGELMEAILARRPEPPARLNPAIPEPLEQVVLKALEKDRELRYQSAADLRTDLQRLLRDLADTSSPLRSARRVGAWPAVAAVAAAVLVVALFALGRRRADSPPTDAVAAAPAAAPAAEPAADRRAIAVLAFADLSPGGDQEYFAHGLSEELIHVLAKNPRLRVSSRTSAFSFKGKDADAATIGAQLGVTHLLEGSVRKAGDELRVTAQLIEIATDSHLWSETYDRRLENVFAVQNDIAAAVARELEVALEAGTAASIEETSPEAYTAYLRGRYFLSRRSEVDFEKAVEAFEAALRSDPEYARAWALLAATHAAQGDWGYVPAEEAYARARRAVERALELEPDLTEGLTRLAWIRMSHDWDWAGADAVLRRALELEPFNLEVVLPAAWLAAALGRFDEALRLDRRAIELDPLRVATYSNLGYHAYYAGRLDEAEAALREGLELNPRLPGIRQHLGLVHLARSDARAALAEMEQEPEPLWRDQGLALALHAAGRAAEADAALAGFVETHGDDAAFQVAEIHAYRGETERAFEWLERAYELRDPGLAELKGDPLLASLHDDPRWAVFLAKMGLAGEPSRAAARRAGPAAPKP